MIDVRKKEMKLSAKKLGVKTIYFQNISTRTLKDKIFKTFVKIRKIIISKKIDTLQNSDIGREVCSVNHLPYG